MGKFYFLLSPICMCYIQEHVILKNQLVKGNVVNR